MRTQVVFTVLLAAILGLAGIFWWKKPGRPPGPAVGATPILQTTEPASAPAPVSALAATSSPVPAPTSLVLTETNGVATNAPADHPDLVVKAKIERLEELQLNYDKESLAEILAELASPHPAIRRAAIEATTQFRDRAAIPVLKELAGRTTDPQEKQELLDAIEYLSLPTFTEVREAKKQMREENAALP